MNGKVKFRIGDIVYHKTLALGQGKVRYIYRSKLLVAFENSPAGRYSREELCKTEPHPAAQPEASGLPRAA